MRRPLITLTTDFGLADPYVAAVKGVIASIDPDARVVDISHEIEPQDIGQGAFMLETALPFFPQGSIHIAVVDPGVGTQRRAIALVTPASVFIGPDNGILSPCLADPDRASGDTVHLPVHVRGFQLTNERLHRRPVSATFHARDIFAPVAAHLSRGLRPEELGDSIETIVALPPFRAVTEQDGSLSGRIIQVDRFGNLITTVHAEQLGTLTTTVTVAGRVIQGRSVSYGERDGLSALVGSCGYLEIALNCASAARELGARIGDPVRVRLSTAPR